MATSNFWVKNAQKYYALLDTIEQENENGVVEEYERDYDDWQDLMSSITYHGHLCGEFPYRAENGYNKMEARAICVGKHEWDTFGKSGKAWTTETAFESTIYARSGYYSGAVLDYDIEIQSALGDNFHLMDYDSTDDLIDDYLDCIKGNIEWKGDCHGWNMGTFKMQRKNIRSWIEKRLQKEIDKCEKFCKDNCDCVLAVTARFSNGETWYSKVE